MRAALRRFLPGLLLLTLPAGALGSAGPAPAGTWGRAETSLAVLGLAGTLALASQDEAVRTLAQRNDGSPLAELATAGDLLGHPLTLLGGSVLLWSSARLADAPQLAATGRQATQAVLGATATAILLKVAVGRERPGGDADHFHPLRLDDASFSLPSAHSAAAFACAAVLARRSPASWHGWSAYALATLVGLGRIVADEHWASDVAAGALLGELWGRWAVADRREAEVGLVALPQPGGGLFGIVAFW